MIVGFDCQFRGKVSFVECLRCAATQRNPCPFDFALLAAMTAPLQEKVSGIRVTQLTGCLRQAVLETRHDYYDRPERCYYAFRGTMIHRILEEAQLAGAVRERRFTRVADGLAITGQPDAVFPRARLLREYKTIRRIAPWLREPLPAHAEQVNCYAWLLQGRFPIARAEILYLDMSGTARFVVPLRPLDEVERLIVARARRIREGLGGGKLPPRLGPERSALCRGYCPFTARCWRRGFPARGEAGRKEVTAEEEEGEDEG